MDKKIEELPKIQIESNAKNYKSWEKFDSRIKGENVKKYKKVVNKIKNWKNENSFRICRKWKKEENITS